MMMMMTRKNRFAAAIKSYYDVDAAVDDDELHLKIMS